MRVGEGNRHWYLVHLLLSNSLQMCKNNKKILSPEYFLVLKYTKIYFAARKRQGMERAVFDLPAGLGG